MTKKQINIRASDLTRQQLDQLAEWWGTSQTETLALVTDKVYREEKQKHSCYIAYPAPEVIEALDEIDDSDILVVNNAIALDIELDNLPEPARRFFENGKVKKEYIKDLSLYMSHRIWSK